jgi:DNA-binding NtrC family response regulator
MFANAASSPEALADSRRSVHARPGTGGLDTAGRATIKILLVEDERTLSDTCANVLRLDGYDVTVTRAGQEALHLIAHRPFDIVLADLHMPKIDGMTVMARALAAHPGTIVVLMTDNPTVESSIEALGAGAWEYLAKPFSAAQLQVVIGRASHRVIASRHRGDLLRTVGEEGGSVPILGVSAGIRNAVELAARVARSDASVFISGESGSGKELVARFIHENSRRNARPFVAVNCAALPETLLESEMFGHCRGAFTGAVRDKTGLLEAADGGTLFLDELIELPKPAQAKLLRVVQDGVVRRVGSDSTDAVVDVRFISATNGDLETARRDGILREDLYYRMCVVPIHLPPLRERREDVALLANHFLLTFWEQRGQMASNPPELKPSALDALRAYPWPGNVRELQNVIEHVTVLAEPGMQIGPVDLPLGSGEGIALAGSPGGFVRAPFDERYHEARERVLTQFETEYLTWLVDRAAGNLSEAARIAGVDRTTLYRVMERHGWRRPHDGRGWTPIRGSTVIPGENGDSANSA